MNPQQIWNVSDVGNIWLEVISGKAAKRQQQRNDS